MKILIALSLTFLSFFIFISCKKESVGGTQTVIVHDTVVLPLPTRKQILVAKDWNIDALLRNENGVNTEYIKGVSNNTGTAYQNIKIRFNADNTGTYTDEIGGTHTLNWSFTTSDERIVSLTIGPPYANTFIWKLFEINGTYLHGASAYPGGLVTFRYKQIP
ncbi:MAG: hypothetical protein ABIY51_07155 [Ferruginibacter sp.]